MKYLIKYSVLLITSLFLLACTFLQQYPDSRTNTEINDLDKVDQLLAGAYPTTSYFRFLEARTDNIGYLSSQKREASRLNQAMYYWRDYVDSDVDSPTAYWNDCWRGIAQANLALQALDKYSNKKDERAKSLYGEAFLIRAYYQFMLANIWAPNYQGEAASDTIPALPYLLLPEKHSLVVYPRLSMLQYYKNLEKDILLGCSLIDNNYVSNKAFRFTRASAYALACRFFAYKGDWQKVIDYSSLPLGADPVRTIPAYDSYRTMAADSSFMIKQYSQTTNPENLLMASVESNWQSDYKNDAYCITSDVASSLFYAAGNLSPVGYQIASYASSLLKTSLFTYYYPKFINYNSSVALLNPKRGHYTYNVLFRTDEVLLHRVEAFAMLNKTSSAFDLLHKYFEQKHKSANTSDISMQDLRNNVKVDLRQTIQPFYRPLSSDQAILLYAASYFTRLEYIHEGLRWFDIRRFNLRVDRNKLGEVKLVENILQPEDSRKIMPLPQYVKLQAFKK